MSLQSIKINSAATVTTHRKWQIELIGAQIVQILRDAGHAIPKDATISFHVPGGGDWSNMAIEINAEHPLYIEWETRSIETQEA